MQNNHIKNYWENQASLHGESHEASWGDNYMLDLEIETIGKYIKNDDEILDVGCANGYSTFRQFESHHVKNITGIDFSEKMIEVAKNLHSKKGCNNRVKFDHGDIRFLKFQNNTFDIVYTTRVLINLSTWEEQMHAIKECLRVTKTGGKVIFSEGFWEPLVLLNSLRTLKQLPPLVEHDFNRYLKKQKLETFLKDLGVQFIVEDFSSIYYLGSRFLRELVTDSPSYPGFTNPINEIFYNIEKNFSGGGFGIQQAYIIEKQ